MKRKGVPQIPLSVLVAFIAVICLLRNIMYGTMFWVIIWAVVSVIEVNAVIYDIWKMKNPKK